MAEIVFVERQQVAIPLTCRYKSKLHARHFQFLQLNAELMSLKYVIVAPLKCKVSNFLDAYLAKVILE